MHLKASQLDTSTHAEGQTWEILRVSPHAIEHQGIFDCLGTCGALPAPIDCANVLNKHAITPEEPSMHHKHALRDDGGERADLKQLLEHHKDGCVVLALHLVEESSSMIAGATIHLKVFVVASASSQNQKTEYSIKPAASRVHSSSSQKISTAAAMVSISFQIPD